MAQLGARFHGMEEVIGSIPIRSTNKINNLQVRNKKAGTPPIGVFFFWNIERALGGEIIAVMKTAEP